MLNPVRKASPNFRWEGVEPQRYKTQGEAPFRDVSRQVLFEVAGAQWRYFEVAPGGWTTLERHAHPHAVMVLRGRGRCMVAGALHELAAHDLVEVAPLAWHQFRASADSPLGFLCLVSAERDRPQLPDREALAALRADAAIADFLDGR
ncbi:MAG: cupin domain-containing protein [Burkholderiaceae bacterium]|nr:cupin domain-containing protein [Burkholderiaceae bacterium]